MGVLSWVASTCPAEWRPLPFQVTRRKGYCTLTGDKLCLRPPLQDTSRCLAGQTRGPHADAVTAHPVAAPVADQTSQALVSTEVVLMPAPGIRRRFGPFVSLV